MDPGVSLFSGEPEPLQLTGSSQNHQEEEEALVDQQRRDQELQNLLTDAFDDLMEEEDDDDRSTISSHHQNGFQGHSNSGSTGSNHQSSPHYYSYNHNQAHPLATLESPPQEIYREDNFGSNHGPSFRAAHGQVGPNLSNGYTSSEEMANMKHTSSNQYKVDHFGYLSSIPHDTHENLFERVPCLPNGLNPDEDLYRKTDLNGQDQLMVLYAARMQEVSNISKELSTLRRERDVEVEQLKRKLLLLEAEKQGAFLSHKEAQGLLGDYQSKISKLQQDTEELRLKNISLEKSKEELGKELEVAKASAVDLIQKVSILERNGSGLQSEKHVESFLKSVQQQHETQVKELQSQIESLTQKFSQKDHECCILERKLRDAQRAQEALIMEKGEVVNELNRQLEEAQRRVRDLASSVDCQESMRLKLQVEQLQAEGKILEEKLKEASKRIEAAEKDLLQYETISKMGLLSNGDSSFETDSITQLGINRRHSHGGRTEKGMDISKDSSKRSVKSLRDRDDLNSQLRDELHRALQGQKSKREEIRRLQGELAVRDQKIKTMKEQEKVYFAEAEKFKKNLTAVLERLKRQEEEAKSLHSKSDDLKVAQVQTQKYKKEKENLEKDLKDLKVKLEQMKHENESLREQLGDMELQLEQAKVKQVDQTAAEFLAFHDESLARLRQESNRQLEAQVIDYRVRMEQSQKECEEIKRLYIEVCSAKRAMLTELQEEQARVRKLSSEVEDMKEAQQSLEELHKQERELNRRLRADLEKEQEKSCKSVFEVEKQIEEKVSSRISSLQLEQERRVDDLLKARDKAVERADKLQQQVLSLEQDCLRLQKLEAEFVDLRKKAIEAPQRQQAELERISRELKQSRERVIELEKRLRAEFQSQMDAMVAERDSIQAQLKQKDNQLEEYLQALSRIRPPTREVSVVTDFGFKEVSSEEFDKKVSEIKAQLKEKHENQLMLLEAQHKDALSSTEEKVKEETVRYFAEEISRMEDKHRGELGSFAKKLVEMECAFAKHLSSVKHALQLKTCEVDELNKKLQDVHQGKVLNGNLGPDDSSQLRRYVEQMKEQTESDRSKMTEALTRWADEVKELQVRESELEKKLEEVKVKYKTARKAAMHYKKISIEKEKHMENEWNRLQSGYREALNRVQARVIDIVGGQEQEVAEQLKRIESFYETQIRDLADKLKHKAVIS